MAEAKQLDDNIRIGEPAARMSNTALGVGVVCIGAAFALGMNDWKGLLHSYLVAFMFVLSICLGALWFVTIQHLVGAKWSVVVRRVAEILASNMPLLALLSLGIIVPTVFQHDSSLYAWADHQKVEADHLLHHKEAYLNPTFFLIRCGIYFGFWVWLSRYFLSRSVEQDESGKPELSDAMARVSAPSMIAFALTLTFCAIDFLMSLDYAWFSTMFGVYYFAGCVSSGYSALALCLLWLQKNDRLTKSVNTEHLHDIGKMMFAFVVFWAYIAFSQFMLIWYADLPEETLWYKHRFTGDWKWISTALLVGHFVIPFFGLLSRHVKRNKKGLAFWAVWLLAVQYLDIHWLVFPNLGEVKVGPDLLDLLFAVGFLGLFFGMAARRAQGVNLVPVKDPHLSESLAFENI